MILEITDKEFANLLNRLYSTEQLILLKAGKITEEFAKENNLSIAAQAAIAYEQLSDRYLIKTYGIELLITVLGTYLEIPRSNLIQEIAAQANKLQLERLLELSIVKNNPELLNSINNIIKLNSL